MSERQVSVVIVSRNRPAALLHCLKGIEQQFYDPFEVVIVADPKGVAAIAGSIWAGAVKLVEFDRPNISAARNLGIEAAAGEIVAFIDDDAVPEPSWLGHLVAAFQQEDIAAAGGFVRGRNGISFQSKARFVDRVGDHRAIPMTEDAIAHPVPPEGQAVKTEGTNCAFRREWLCELGGFDPAFQFYLDETDLNLRLARAGAKTAIVPMAQVHHGFAASAQRHQSRMPRDLSEIGASQVVFLRKFAPEDRHEAALQNMRKDQRARLLRHMVAGRCEPGDVDRVLATLEAGFKAGETRSVQPLPKLGGASQAFKRFVPSRIFEGSSEIAGRIWSAGRLRRQAAQEVRNGRRVSLFLFSPTTMYHKVRFHPDGYWEQRGGIFGRSDRDQAIFQRETFNSRVIREMNRVQSFRKAED